jgi:hypothetical protein
MQWKDFKRIVEEELGITNETEVWKIDVNLPLASEFLHVERDTLLGTSITVEEPRSKGHTLRSEAGDAYKAAA